MSVQRARGKLGKASCSLRIKIEHENLAKQNPEKETEKRFQIKNGLMKMTNTKKCQFAKLNDKRY